MRWNKGRYAVVLIIASIDCNTRWLAVLFNILNDLLVSEHERLDMDELVEGGNF